MAPDIFPLWLLHVGVTSTHLKYLCSPLINLPVAIKSLLTWVNKHQLFNDDEKFPIVAFSTVALHVVHEIVPLLEVWDTFRKREVFEKITSILKLHIDIHTHYAVIALTIIKSSCWRLFEKTREWINHVSLNEKTKGLMIWCSSWARTMHNWCWPVKERKGRWAPSARWEKTQKNAGAENILNFGVSVFHRCVVCFCKAFIKQIFSLCFVEKRNTWNFWMQNSAEKGPRSQIRGL